MKRSSVICRAFFRRPSVKELVPDLKLALTVITVSCETHCGVYIPGGLSEDVGLDPSALAGALVDLERRGHIMTDSATGEIFVTAWYRDNTFKGGPRGQQWRGDFIRVESAKLKAAVLAAIAASPECGLVVDKNGCFIENQQLNYQGEVKGEVKEKREAEKPAPASPAAAAFFAEAEKLAAPFGAGSCTSGAPGVQKEGLEAFLDRLLSNARRLGGDLARDGAAIMYIRQAAQALGEDRVMSIIKDQHLPSGARKALKAAGADDAADAARKAETSAKAEAVRKAQLAASAAKVNAQAARTGGPAHITQFLSIRTGAPQ